MCGPNFGPMVYAFCLLQRARWAATGCIFHSCFLALGARMLVSQYIYIYVCVLLYCMYIYILSIHKRNLYNLVYTYLGRTNVQDRTSVHKWAQATTFRLVITARTSGSVQRMRCKSHCSVKSYALCCTYSFCSGHVQPCSMSKCCSK